MTSEKQLNANRANATRGTGPKSTSGKSSITYEFLQTWANGSDRCDWR